jgi:glucan 1,3-beta-glucosidase
MTEGSVKNGSGGFMGDIILRGGALGLWLGNQQFTVRNVTIDGAATGIYAAWNWGWTYQGRLVSTISKDVAHRCLGITINNADIGFDIVSGGLIGTVGGVALIDVTITNTSIGIRSSVNSQGSLHGSLAFNNLAFKNVTKGVTVADGTLVIPGSSNTSTIESWVQGNVYSGATGQGAFTQSNTAATTKDASLLDSTGRVVSRGHPQYVDYDVSQFASARSAGAKGNGVTDDTAALQALFTAAANCQVVFLDAGVYYITDTRMSDSVLHSLMDADPRLQSRFLSALASSAKRGASSSRVALHSTPKRTPRSRSRSVMPAMLAWLRSQMSCTFAPDRVSAREPHRLPQFHHKGSSRRCHRH